MESLYKAKFDDDSSEYLSQKIPNSLSAKELYCERDLGVNKFSFFYLQLKFRQLFLQFNTTKEYYLLLIQEHHL